MPKFRFAVIAAALFGMFGATADAELLLAQRGVFTVEDAYSQMGGMPFELSTSVTNHQMPQRLAARS
jgi:hypothetical protein